jgi:CSLREA domain-containing protein
MSNEAEGRADDGTERVDTTDRGSRSLRLQRALVLAAAAGIVAFTLVAVFGGGRAVDASPVCTRSYTGSANDLWETATNWTPTGVPTATDTVCSAPGATISLSTSVSVKAADLNARLNVATTGHLHLTDASVTSELADLAVVGGQVDLAGPTLLDGPTAIVIQGGRLTHADTLTVTDGALYLFVGRIDGAGTVEVPAGSIVRVRADDAPTATISTVDNLHLAGGIVQGYESPSNGSYGIITDLDLDSGSIYGQLDLDGTTYISDGTLLEDTVVRTTAHAGPGSATIDGGFTVLGALRAEGSPITVATDSLSVCGELAAATSDVAFATDTVSATGCSPGATPTIDAEGAPITFGPAGTVTLAPALESHMGTIRSYSDVLALDGGGHARHSTWTVRRNAGPCAPCLKGDLRLAASPFEVSDDAVIEARVEVAFNSTLRLVGDDNGPARPEIEFVHIDGGVIEGVPSAGTGETGIVQSATVEVGEHLLTSPEAPGVVMDRWNEPVDGIDPAYARSQVRGDLTVADATFYGGEISGNLTIADQGHLELQPANVPYLYAHRWSVPIPGSDWFIHYREILEGSDTFLIISGHVRTEGSGGVTWTRDNLKVCGSLDVGGGVLELNAHRSRIIDCAREHTATLSVTGGSVLARGSMFIQPSFTTDNATVLLDYGGEVDGDDGSVVELGNGGASLDSTWHATQDALGSSTHLRLGGGTFNISDRTTFAIDDLDLDGFGGPETSGESSLEVMRYATLRVGGVTREPFWAPAPRLEHVVVRDGRVDGTKIPPVFAVGDARALLPRMQVDGGTVAGDLLVSEASSFTGGTILANVEHRDETPAVPGVLTIGGEARIEGAVTGLRLRFASGDVQLCGRITVGTELTADSGANIFDCSTDRTAEVSLSAGVQASAHGPVVIATKLSADETRIAVEDTLELASMTARGAGWSLPNADSQVALHGPDADLSNASFTGAGTVLVPSGTTAHLTAPTAGQEGPNIRLEGGTIAAADAGNGPARVRDLEATSGLITGPVDVHGATTAAALTISGQLTLFGRATTTEVTVDGALALEGSQLTNNGRLVVKGALDLGSGAMLLNESAIDLHGTGTDATTPAVAPTVTNHASGSIHIDGALSWPGTQLLNQGTLSISDSGSLRTGFRQTGGSVNLASATATLTPSGIARFEGGELAGIGTVAGSINDGGVPNSFTVKPGGDAIGTMRVTGDFVPTGANLVIQTGGLTAGTTHDQLAVTGAAGTAVSPTGLGTLTLQPSNGFVPAVGDRWRVVAAASAPGLRFPVVDNQTGSSGFTAAVPSAAPATGIDAQVFTPPTVTIGDGATTEPAFNSGTSVVHLTVSLSGPVPAPVTVTWSTTNGTALAGSDYDTASGTVTVPAFATTATIDVVVRADTTKEGTETFGVDLGAITGTATLAADAHGDVTIVDDLYDIADNCTKYAIGAVDWGTAANWSPAGVPTASDTVCGMPGSEITVGGSTTASAFGVSSLGGLGIVGGGRLTFTGGTDWSVRSLGVDGRLDVHGTLALTAAGHLYGEIRGGRLQIEPGATFDWLSGALRDGATIDNRGTFNWAEPWWGNPTQSSLCEGSQIVNHGLFTMNGREQHWITDCGSAASKITNAADGTISMNSTYGRAVYVDFDNQGAVNLAVGSLYLHRTNSVPYAGTFTITGAAALFLHTESAAAPVTHRFAATAVLTGAGPLIIDDANALVTAAAGAQFAHIGIEGNGVLAGDPTITASIYNYGHIQGPGTTTINSGATFDWISGGLRGGATVTNLGTFNWAEPWWANATRTELCEGSQIVNHGLFTMNGREQHWITDCGSAASKITNAADGTISMNSTYGRAVFVDFDNQGAVNLAVGSLYLHRTNSVPYAGTFTITGAAALFLHTESAAAPVTHRFAATAVLTGAGPLIIDDANALVTAAAGAQFAHIGIEGNGVLAGDPTITASIYNYGHIQGPGTTTINSGATFDWISGGLRGGATVTNLGTFNWAEPWWANATRTELCEGSQIVNHGLFTMNGREQHWITDCGSAASKITNAADGTISMNSTYGRAVYVDFDNQGSVTLAGGPLYLHRANTIPYAGTFTITSPAALVLHTESALTPVTHRFAASARLEGTGALYLDDANALATAEAGARFNHIAIEANGRLAGSPTITGSAYSYGRIEGPGTTTVAPGATFDWISGGMKDGAVLTNLGAFNWAEPWWANATGTELCGGSQIVNHGLFTMNGREQHWITDCGSAASKITNAADGTITYASTYPRSLLVAFENQGTLDLQSGALYLQRDLANITTNTITGGTFVLNGALYVSGTTAGQVTTNASSFTFKPSGAFVTLASQPILALTRNTPAGRLDYDQDTTLGAFTNEGTVVLRQNRTLSAASYRQTNGTTTVSANAHLTPTSGRLDLDAGRLTGDHGNVDAVVHNNGTVAPGEDPGYPGVLYLGGYVGGPDGHIEIDVTSFGADDLGVAGAPTLDGTLDIRTQAGHLPPVGFSSTVMRGTGTFRAVTGDVLPNGTRYDVTYPYGVVTITVVEGLTVNSTDDRPDWDPNDGVCRTFVNTCTLRAAVQQANALPGTNHIILAPGATYTLTRSGANEDQSVTGDLDIRDGLLISGNGATVDGGQLDRVFDVQPGTSARFDNLTVRNGKVAGNGGGILATSAALTLNQVTVTANAADGSSGGGVLVHGTGTAAIANSTVSNNTAIYGGGIGANDSANVTITGSTVSGNTASAIGGGIGGAGTPVVTVLNSTVTANTNNGTHGGGLGLFGTAHITGSTFSNNTTPNGYGAGILVLGPTTITTTTVTGNTAIGGGGIVLYDTAGATVSRSTIDHNTTTSGGSASGIANFGTLAITASTISGNTDLNNNGAVVSIGVEANTTITSSTVTANTGGGVANDYVSTTALRNTIVAGQLTGNDCNGTIISAGFNHSSDTTCGFTNVGDTQGTPALLGPLANNGGPTKTHLPQAGSPVIGTGDPTCTGLDQRGVTRPAGGTCDKGAVEQ